MVITIQICIIEGQSILGISSLTKIYNQRSFFGSFTSKVALSGVSASYHPHITTIIGPPGCGKSTLSKISIGIDTPTSGSISTREGQSTGALCCNYMDPLFYMTYDENLSIKSILNNQKSMKSCSEDYITHAMELTELNSVVMRKPVELMTTQRKIFEIVLAISRIPFHKTSNSTAVLVLDEYLDKELSNIHYKLQPLIKRLCMSPTVQLQVLIVTHSGQVWRIYSDKTIVLNNGKLFAEGSVKDVKLPSNYQFIQ